MRLFLLLILVPLIEIALFIEVGGLIGVWPTIGIVVLTAIIGSALMRRQGLASLRTVRGRLAAGDDPGRLLADGAMILIAGFLLVIPGFLTDAIGFVLLVPPVREWLWKRLAPRLRVTRVDVRQGGARSGPQPGGSRRGQTVEGEYEVVEPGSGGGKEGHRDNHPPAHPDRR